MNRLSTTSTEEPSPSMPSLVADTLRLREGADEDAPVASFVPMHYESGYAYPLLVWLHGEGQSELDLPYVAPLISTRNYVAVAPRGTRASRDDAGYQWRDAPDHAAEAEDRVVDAIAHASERLNVNSERVFIGGVGCGGTMAMRVALANPHRFAGAATFDGPLPSSRRPLRWVNRVRTLPLLLAASRASRAYPEERICRDLRLLHSAGGTVSVRQYPGDDDLTTAMLSDFDRWMMEIVCGAASRV